MPHSYDTISTNGTTFNVGDTLIITITFDSSMNYSGTLHIGDEDIPYSYVPYGGNGDSNPFEYVLTESGTYNVYYTNYSYMDDSNVISITVNGGGQMSNNDTTTLNGALSELGETIADNLNSMGVSSADATDGLTTLAGKILDIAPSVGGLSLTTSITLSKTPSDVVVGDNVLLSAIVHCDYDDTSQADVDLNGYLQGATVTFKEGNTVLGSSVTDVNGVATYTVNNISSGSHTYSATFDGSSTDYDSATGNLTFNIDHDYSLAFSQSSYTATGGSATLEVTLEDENGIVSGETVTLTGSDSSLYTSITNQNGIASFTVTGLTSATTFTASYGNVSASCTVNVHLFYDDASVDNTNNYGAYWNTEGTNSASLTYGDGYYIITSNGNGNKFFPIQNLAQTDNIRVSIDMLATNRNETTLGIAYSSGAKYSHTLGIKFQEALANERFQNGSWREISKTTYSSFVTNTWYRLIVEITGDTLTGSVYSLTDLENPIVTNTGTRDITIAHNYVGLHIGYSTTSCYFKELKIESL